MADAEAKKRVQKEIAEKVKPQAENAFKGIASSVPQLAKAMKKLSDGLRGGEDPVLLRTHVRELAIRLRDVTWARASAVAALEALEEATKDEDDFEADEAEVEALQAKLVKAKALLGDQIVKAKDLEDKAIAAAKEGAESEKEAHRDWDAIISLFETQSTELATIVKNLRKTQQDAQAAVKARDAAALKAARDEVDHYLIDDDALHGKLLKKRVNEFFSKYDIERFGKEFLQEIAKDRATKVDAWDAKAQALMVEMKKIQDTVDKLAIEPPNAAKATAALGFKANFNTRVEAALKLDEGKMAKRLEELAREAGVTATGKQLVEKLKKEKLL